MPLPTLELTLDEDNLISAIVGRYISMKPGFEPRTIQIIMDIAYCHHHAPLDLEGLLQARDADFVHDVSGIINHIDRTTGRMRDLFSPRFTM